MTARILHRFTQTFGANCQDAKVPRRHGVNIGYLATDADGAGAGSNILRAAIQIDTAGSDKVCAGKLAAQSPQIARPAGSEARIQFHGIGATGGSELHFSRGQSSSENRQPEFLRFFHGCPVEAGHDKELSARQSRLANAFRIHNGAGADKDRAAVRHCDGIQNV